MGRFIRISTRRNLFYLSQVVLYYYSRKVVLIIINNLYKFNDSLIFTFLMLLGEFFAGIAIYLYQIYFFETKNDIKIKYFEISLIIRTNKLKRPDNKKKITLLIFFTACFDFTEFIIENYYLPKFSGLSKTIVLRFGGIIIIFSSLLCYFNLKMDILKHQLCSLISIGLCSIIIIILEIIFSNGGRTIGEFFQIYFLVLNNLIFVAFTDVVEKYLLEYDYMNPFIILIIESSFGLILTSFYSINHDPLKDLKRLYGECDTGKFILLIFLLFLYLAFSAGANVYKLLSNVLYSPMAKSLAGYILNPFVFIYYFLNENDFSSDGEKNYLYFFINLIISIIISFFGCVYNEFLVLSFCGLDYETYSTVTIRALTSDKTFEISDNGSDY